ncbi:archaellin/type IV pilin N-terminal domain-containing protein [Methanosarcina sp.]|uniref:archaellin/type IV pilin N-terminal domain-containing protein n=1 Tax=Methanosarcina sp. TaxID=2213 RepID=UPI002AB97C17|nr:archaellin/type IV pilin N-terminal domain-containing protein [Methanosarcina sp.]MDY9927921.1 archaellin/type IV pilin N-terminal domain-containing protein [Methanosarcina sp.]
MWNKFIKNEKGFTGLEAAIVLVAFVVVAAVFSYVMLGAGFYTTQKSQEVVHTGVQQASSSVELSGNLIAKGDAGTPPTFIKTLTVCLQLTSGGSSVDMAKTLMVVSAPDIPPTELTLAGAADADNFAVAAKYNANADNIIDKAEKFDITIDLDAVAGANDINANDEFQLEIKPPQGASYTIHRQAPASISAIMTLV